MEEIFMGGIQYTNTIIAAGNNGRLVALEQALPDFKQHGVDASIESSTPSVVTIDVYVSVAKRPKRFSPPPITRQTAEAYRNLIQNIRECGYAHIGEIRDGRTGLGEISDETPIFEVVDINNH